jgi:hypothetical protein
MITTPTHSSRSGDCDGGMEGSSVLPGFASLGPLVPHFLWKIRHQPSLCVGQKRRWHTTKAPHCVFCVSDGALEESVHTCIVRVLSSAHLRKRSWIRAQVSQRSPGLVGLQRQARGGFRQASRTGYLQLVRGPRTGGRNLCLTSWVRLPRPVLAPQRCRQDQGPSFTCL